MPHSVTPLESKLFTYPIFAWGLGLLFLYALGNPEIALALCYPLALWQGAASLWWGRRTAGRLRAGEITRAEADGGVAWVGQLLATTAATPAIIFLAANPLHQAAWATCASVAILSALSYGGVTLLVRLSNRYAHALALALACAALPLNATGAVSLGFWYGLLDPLVELMPADSGPAAE